MAKSLQENRHMELKQRVLSVAFREKKFTETSKNFVKILLNSISISTWIHLFISRLNDNILLLPRIPKASGGFSS